MNKKRLNPMLLMVIISFLLLSFSCATKDSDEPSPSANSLLGKWESIGYWDMPGYCPAQNSWSDNPGSVVEFMKGGQVKFSGSQSFVASYSLDGSSVIIDNGGKKQTYSYEINKDNQLVLITSTYPHGVTNQYSDCRHQYKYIYGKTGASSGGGNKPSPSKSFAPASAIGKTFVIGYYTIRVTGASSCTVTLGMEATMILTGTPTCSYTKKGDNSAELKLTVNFKPEFAGMGYTSGTFRFTFNLTYNREDGGTYTGYNSYTYVGGTLAGSSTTNINGSFSMF